MYTGEIDGSRKAEGGSKKCAAFLWGSRKRKIITSCTLGAIFLSILACSIPLALHKGKSFYSKLILE